MMWLDVLDVPTVNHFETSFFEDFDEAPQNTRAQDGDSLDRFGSGVCPMAATARSSAARSSIIPMRA